MPKLFRPLMAALGLAGTVVALARRRQAKRDGELWREATSDTSR